MWDYLILAAAIYNSINIPLMFAFDELDNFFRNDAYMFTLRVIINIFYTIDVIFGFLTTY